MRSRARACMMRADPNMEPRAVERQAVAMPSTTKYCETHEACGGDSVGSTWGAASTAKRAGRRAEEKPR